MPRQSPRKILSGANSSPAAELEGLIKSSMKVARSGFELLLQHTSDQKKLLDKSSLTSTVRKGAWILSSVVALDPNQNDNLVIIDAIYCDE